MQAAAASTTTTAASSSTTTRLSSALFSLTTAATKRVWPIHCRPQTHHHSNQRFFRISASSTSPSAAASSFSASITLCRRNYHSTMMNLRESLIPTPGVEPDDKVDLASVEPVKSQNDDRRYRSIYLPNKLQVLLVSDPTTDKAAAGMDVRVGHFQDPDQIPGLAHFCEHMLFLGTEKYPDENSYNSFLSSHGGRSNAYTGVENTNYYFDVTHEHLEEALDRFSQFFIAPLFTEDATDREMNAVDSENAKNLQSDNWRLYQLLKHSANPRHPFHKFGTGNLYTLKEVPTKNGIDVRQALLDFHSKYYSANIMKLAVLGREPLDQLEEWVTKYFSTIPNKDRKVILSDSSILPFGPEQQGFIYKIVPVKDIRNLVVMFPLPSMREFYLEKPTRYYGHLIGHEAEGSLLSLLKNKGWANELEAGSSRNSSDFELFKVTVRLTDEGLEHVEDIVGLLMEYIRLLKESRPQEWIYSEVQSIGSIDFRFKEKEHPINYVSNVSSNMQHYPANHVLSGPYLFEKYDEKLLTDLLSNFNPNNMCVQIISKKFEGSTIEEEPWYKTPYTRERMSEEQLAKWNQLTSIHQATAVGESSVLKEGAVYLSLPKPNEFIPADFKLKELPEMPPIYPENVLSRGPISLWFKQDNTFKVPKAEVRMAFLSPVAYLSPKHAVLTHLYTKLLEDSLNEYSYNAHIAGLKFVLSSTNLGLELRVNGYNEKLPLLLKKIGKRMINLSPNETRFREIKEKIKRDYKNFYLNQPWEHARYELGLWLLDKRWSVEEKLEAIEGIELNDLVSFIPRLLEGLKIDALCMGNMHQEEATELCQSFLKEISPRVLCPAEVPTNRVVRLEDGTTYTLRMKGPNKDNKNSAIYQYYQVGLVDVETDARLDLLAQIAHESAFDQLRTKEQLGYIVWSGVRSVYGVCGFRFIIQSSVKDPTYLDERVEAYLQKLREYIVTMSNKEFEDHKKALIAQLEEKDKTLSQEVRRHWDEITNHTFLFDRTERQVKEEKEKVDRDVMLDFFDRFLLPSPSSSSATNKRSKLSIQIFGKDHPLPEAEKEEEAKEKEEEEGPKELGKRVDLSKVDPTSFKNGLYLYPVNS